MSRAVLQVADMNPPTTQGFAILLGELNTVLYVGTAAMMD
jgi:hypothetical protein